MINYENLNKNDIYCYKCYKQNIISKIKNNKFICTHDPRYTFTLQFCDKCDEFTAHKGVTGKCSICNSPFKNYYNSEKHLNQARESAKILSNKINSKNCYKYCKECNKETYFIYGGNKCSVCLGKNMNKVQNSKNCYKYCKKCNKVVWHISGGKVCVNCNNIQNKLNLSIEELNKLNIKYNYKIINYINLLKLKQNDICGTYLIRGKFKENHKIYNILVCKSIKIYNEINWVLRVISQPEKQDKNYKNWTIAKWWYIANLYYDFEFILLTDENGVSEEEALICEAKYAFDNDMTCNKEQIVEDGYSSNHSYWSF